MSKIFSKGIYQGNEKIKVGGWIKYYNLEDWWLKELNDNERRIIRETYTPITSSGEDIIIDKGSISYTSASKLAFIGGLVGWFKDVDRYNIALKIIQLGEDNIKETKDILDVHFFYLNCIRVLYKNRDNYTDALDRAIEYCEKQINISNQSKIAFEKCKYFKELPSHTGYKQLAIIYEKRKEYDKALELTQKALEEGWNDDCQKRIDRLIKKIDKRK
ncbi:Uncharacterised protein [[Clostridium] sordellii]|uniref:tetratricopeptide repeat protein n=1 Tax=Paraclostridium sordellii TaxID=1505 RepID=UPI0005DF16B9|nr:tetratricopeptide repeat protein [Paeniclostridium sordellii]CEQ01683.1 Uncharacterised protein [[Clostridium] sordellii] [Paeniclostridium sordellii]